MLRTLFSSLVCLALASCGSDSPRTFEGSGGASGSGAGGNAATSGAGGNTGGVGGSAGSGGSAATGGQAGSAGSAGSGGGSGCPGGTTLCGADCKNTATDAEHCGACDRSCLGTQCVAGGCTPENVALQASVGVLGVDDTHVYFSIIGMPTSQSSLARRPKNGGAVASMVPSIGQPEQLLVEAQVYFSGPVYLNRIAKTGGAVTTLSPNRPTNLTANASQLVFSRFVLAGSTYELWYVNKAGGGELNFYDQSTPITSLAATGNHAFFTSAAQDGITRKALAVAGAPSTLFGTEYRPSDLVLDSGELVWVTKPDGANTWVVRRGTPDGADAETLLTIPLATQANFTVDSQGIYWTEPESGVIKLRGADRDGKNVRTLSGDLGPAPNKFVLDATHVYYRTTGGIFRVAR